jgi:hypothetical protein
MSELDKWTLERIRYLLEPSNRIVDEMEHDDPAELVCDPVEDSSEMEYKQVLHDILDQYELTDLIDLRDHLEGLKEIRDDVCDEFCNEFCNEIDD